MADESINIKVTEDGTRVVQRNFEDLAASATKAKQPIDQLNTAIKSSTAANFAGFLGAGGGAQLERDTAALSKFAAQTSITSTSVREMLTLGREASVGNWTRFAGSFTILAQNLGRSNAGFGQFFINLAKMTTLIKTTQDAELAEAAANAVASQQSIQAAAARAASNVTSADTELALAQAQLRVATTSAEETAAQERLALAHEAVVAAAAEATIAEEALATATAEAAGAVRAVQSTAVTGLGALGTALAVLAPIAAIVAGNMKSIKDQLNDDGALTRYRNSLGLTHAEMLKLSDSTTKLKDGVKELGPSVITWGDTFHGLVITIRQEMDAMGKNISDALGTIGINWSKVWSTLMQFAYDAFLGFYASVMTLVQSIDKIFINTVTIIFDAFKVLYNGLSMIITEGANKVIDGLNLMGRASNTIFGTSFGQMDHWKSGVDSLTQGLKGLVDVNVGATFAKNVNQADQTLTNFKKKWGENTLAYKEGILWQEAEAMKENRAGKHPHQKKTQGDYIDDELNKLNQEISRMGMLKDAREEQQKLDQIEQSFIQRKMPLDAQQIAMFKQKLDLIQQYRYQQEAMDKIDEQFNGAQKVYNGAMAAANDLLQRGVISEKQYALAVAESTQTMAAANDLTGITAPYYEHQVAVDKVTVSLENYIKTNGKFGISQQQASQAMTLADRSFKEATDPLFSLNEQTDKAVTAAKLYGDAVQQNAFYQQVYQAFLAKGTDLTKNATAADLAEAKAIIEKNKALQQQQYIQSAITSILNPILDDAKLLASKQQMYAELERLRQTDLKKEGDYARAKAALDAKYLELRLQGAQSFFGELAQLSRSKNKELAAIGKAAAVAQATIDGVLAAQKALSQYPPPLSFAMAAAVGAVTAVNIAEILSTNANFAVGGSFIVPGTGGPDSQMVGLRLTPGEQVDIRTPTQVRKGSSAVNGHGDGAPHVSVPVKVVNVHDKSQVYEALADEEGTKVILNVIRNNPSVIQTVGGVK